MNILDAIRGNASRLVERVKAAPDEAARLVDRAKAPPGEVADLFTPFSPEMTQQLTGQLRAQPKISPKESSDMAMNFLQTTNPMMGLAGTFIGEGAKTWDKYAAEEATRLLRKGIDPHMTTGVHQGVDDILRQEIPDNAAKFHPGALEKLNNSDYLRMEKLLDHPELYKAYPELRNLEVSSARGMDSSYHPDPEGDFIQLGRDSLDHKSSLLHEIQHKIQQTEGWAKGGAPSSFKAVPNGPSAMEQYKRLAGEVESRNTQKRMDMNKTDLRREHPYSTMDREIQDQAVWGVGEEFPGVVRKQIKGSK